MRTLKVDWDDFETASECDRELMRGYVDLSSGRAFFVDEESCELVREFLESSAPDATIDDLLKSEEMEGLSEDAARNAWLLETDVGHVVQLDRDEFRESYTDLAEFTATMTDAELRRELERAINGPGAFGRFRNVISGTFRERKQWFAFREERMREKATEWFAAQDIAVEWVLPNRQASGPPPRQHLLQGVLKFVQSAAQIVGVKRIALIGSLTRSEPDPKDADLLVTITDDMDLAALAKAGRKLAGHAQHLGRGADVFLANERGEYIGRTCPWRDCAPGIRVRCDAQNCGRRHYLHDDLQSVRLDAKLVAEPPVELWPAVRVRVAAPEDVEREVLEKLRQGT